MVAKISFRLFQISCSVLQMPIMLEIILYGASIPTEIELLDLPFSLEYLFSLGLGNNFLIFSSLIP